jgi:uncharacterized membrane protein YfcA
MKVAIGFFAALIVGLTGVGGGSFTTPALILLAGTSGAEAVGTALVFATVIRLIAAPFYVFGQKIHIRYLFIMLLGAIPGVLAGTYLLRKATALALTPLVLAILGTMLVTGAVLTAWPSRPILQTVRSRPSRWLACLALPLGVETGFSSAGSGALGSLLLFNFTPLSPTQVIGTDMVFGTALTSLGALFHFSFGTVNLSTLQALLEGGLPGVLIGCLLAPQLPAQLLRKMVLALTMLLGIQLLLMGTR